MIAIVNLTVGTVCQRQLQIVITIIVGSTVDDVPFININLAVFKVPQNLGSLAQVQLHGGSESGIGNQGSSYGTGEILRSILFIHSNEVQTVKPAQGLVVGGERNVIGTQAPTRPPPMAAFTGMTAVLPKGMVTMGCSK